MFEMNRAYAEKGNPASFDDRAHGIQRLKDPPFFGDHGHRINDGSRVHPQLHQKIDNALHILVSGSEHRQPKAATQAQCRSLKN